jgi:hypothetical protein
VRKLAYTPDALRREVAERVPHLARAQIVVPHAVPEPLVARVRRQVGRGTSHERALRLVDILTNPDELGLVHEPLVTYTAEETLERGRGNCLSLGSLLVGLARGIGLEAYYPHATNRGYQIIHDAQEVGSPIPWGDVLERFEAATFASPTLAAAWNNRGIAYGRLGEVRKAELRSTWSDTTPQPAIFSLGSSTRDRGGAAGRSTGRPR